MSVDWISCKTLYTEEESNILVYSHLISALLALLGSSFVMTSYFILSRKRTFSHILLALSFSGYLWAISVIINFVWALIYPQSYTLVPCILGMAFFHVFAGSSIGWTLIFSIYLYMVITKPLSYRSFTNKGWMFMHMFAWGLPIISVIINTAIPESIKVNSLFHYECVPAHPWALILWYGPNTLFYFAGWVVCIIFVVKLSSLEESSFKAINKRVLLYILVFIVCWSPDIASYYVSLIAKCIPLSLAIVAFTMQQLQGLFVAMIYCISNEELAAHYKNMGIFKLLIMIIVSPIYVWVISIPMFIWEKCNDDNKKVTEMERRPFLILQDEDAIKYSM